MADALLAWLRQSLPQEISDLVEPYITRLERGDYQSLLQGPEARLLSGLDNDDKTKDIRLDDFATWSDFIFHRLGSLLADRTKPGTQYKLFCIGYAALLAFLQSNVTGPPLPFSSGELLFSQNVAQNPERLQTVRQALLASLSMDGIAAYKLTPNVELLCLADAIMTCPPILKNVKPSRWAKMRVSFMQQRLLSEISSTLQNVVYDDLTLIQDSLHSIDDGAALKADVYVEFLLERASIHIHHGLDKLARADLDLAKKQRHFEFSLTGLLGKRTKFQEKDVSQLVVLAKSVETDNAVSAKRSNGFRGGLQNGQTLDNTQVPEPIKLDLNDDTLLESTSFSQKRSSLTSVQDEESLPPGLASLDPSNQPQLEPLDSMILLLLASSITNTLPQHGLTREQTLPYAIRVLEGGSSNWQVYTQALLVRSRIEGYKSRTVERGLLQLQVLVDQVIINTGGTGTEISKTATDKHAARSFLPLPKETESAPVNERLRYIFQLAPPTRWDLEAELAARWVQLGGLRSALEIYKRLEMWAEAAICWAATDQEDKAKRIVRRQLFHATDGRPDQLGGYEGEDETWHGADRDPAPLDAPRLYCILGDLDQCPSMYEKAWAVSNKRYARAQRSLGRHYFAAKDYVKATEAYSKSLKVNQLNHSSWFALGCALLELAQFDKAVEAFSRCIQLDDTDAESWSNLAAALLHTETESNGSTNGKSRSELAETGNEGDRLAGARHEDPQKRKLDALKALNRAASLKHDSFRILENVLVVAASLSPPDYTSILSAQRRIIKLRGVNDGEKCIDKEALQMLLQHVISTSETFDPSQPGLQRLFVKFVDESVVPLITGSVDLWRIVSKLAVWRSKPLSALDAEEKAWRAITSQPGWETESENRWNEVVEATVRLCDAYESLGPKERTEGLSAGEPVAKDWKFKARSAIRTILGRGKGTWEGTAGWSQLKDVTEGMKG